MSSQNKLGYFRGRLKSLERSWRFVSNQGLYRDPMEDRLNAELYTTKCAINTLTDGKFFKSYVS